MRRFAFAMLVLALVVPAAWSHFIWIVPDKDGTTAQVIFSDSLQPDDPDLLAKIGKTEVFVRQGDKTTPLKWTKGKDTYQLTIPGKEKLVGAVCKYGVIEKGKGDPFLLVYGATASLRGGRYPVGVEAAGLPLEVQYVDNNGNFPLFRVLWKGKPLPDAEVVALTPGAEKSREAKTGKDGHVNFSDKDWLQDWKPGLYGVRARHVEAQAGEHDGKKYKEVRYYATLVMRLDEDPKRGAAAPKEDPAASKLLQAARAARAKWTDFPGFTANVEVNFDGKTTKGTVHVDPAGKVRFEGIDKDMEPWARRTLASVVSHRLDDSSTRNTPCAFPDANDKHPLGRAILVLNDELHSSYRIRDNQITEVNRQMTDGKFTISVLENRLNADNKYLSVSYVVSYWKREKVPGEKTPAMTLSRTEGHHQTWTRVGKLDLPATTTVITAESHPLESQDGGRTAHSVTLSNHKLLSN